MALKKRIVYKAMVYMVPQWLSCLDIKHQPGMMLDLLCRCLHFLLANELVEKLTSCIVESVRLS